jgi:hypothetical protein
MTILDSLQINCLGRGREADHLKSVICGKPPNAKPAVLIFGDSGIGKTTLLRSLCEIIPSQYPDVLMGFYSVQGGETDPLLWSLDSLLKSIYTLQNWSLQLPTAWTNLAHKLSKTDLSDLRKFLTKIVGEGKSETSLGIFGNTILSVAGSVGTAISSLDAKIDETLLRPQDIDEFCRVLSLLIDALPDRTFVLIIDNLNAASRTAIEVIEAYLSQHSTAFPSVHLVFSWKRELGNVDALHHLRKRVKEYGGDIMHLEHITSRQAICDWLRSQFSWFGNLSDKERESVITQTFGLPEVIVRWTKYSLDNFDEKALSHIAEEVRAGKYSEIADMLAEAEPFDQRLLYALALADRPMSVQGLTACFGSTYAECRKMLQKWSRDNFVLRNIRSADDPDEVQMYTYDHDMKRAVALDQLPAEIGDSKEVAETLYAFFLKNFGGNQPGFARFLGAAIAVSEKAGVSASQRTEIGELITLIDAGRAPDRPWRLSPHLPKNLSIHYLAYSLHAAYGDRKEILEAISQMSWDLPTIKSEALASTSGVVHIMAHLKPSDSERGIYLRLLDIVRSAYEQFGRSEPFSALLSRGLAAYPSVFGKHDEIYSSELVELTKRFPSNEEIAACWAQMLAREIIPSANRGEKISAAEALPKVEQLNEIRDRFPNSLRFAEASGTISRVLAGARIDMTDDQILAMFGDLRGLQAKHPQSISLAEDLAEALVRNSPDLWRGGPNHKLVLAEMRSLRSRYPNERRIAKSLLNAVEVARMFIGVSEAGELATYAEELDAEIEELKKEFDIQE